MHLLNIKMINNVSLKYVSFSKCSVLFDLRIFELKGTVEIDRIIP